MADVFVLAIKNRHSNNEVYKARFVAQGHRDKEKSLLIHPTSTIRQRSIRLIIAIATIYSFTVWTQDISQAYLQSKDKLSRKVYIRPGPEFNLSKEQLLELLKPLYGLSDAGDYWDVTIVDFTKNDLHMTSTSLDPSFFYRRNETTSELDGLTGIHVDDGLHAGTKEFSEDNRKN